MEENKNHGIILENREKLTISGVEDVESFDEEKVVIITEMGTMTVSGAEFRISRLNVDNGELIIEGEVDEIAYSNTVRDDRSGGFFGRLFR
ncbi:MAG: sporulation protein YabP [Clostridia bacterium]|nr:sporulation protein YabP [Clostridia bacterium]